MSVREIICAMAIPNGIGLVAYGTLRYVANNVPGRVEWWEIGGLDGDRHGAHEGPQPGHLIGSSERP
jgi:hypothetical protein